MRLASCRQSVSSCVAVALLFCSSLAGCGAATVVAPLLSAARRTTVRTLDVSLDVPTGLDRKKPHVWTLDSGGVRHAMLWLERKPMPKDGVDAWVARTSAVLGRGGVAGVTRREVVHLGDLEGHLLEAVTLIGQTRHCAMQLMVGAEDGMYVASVLATIEAMRRNHKAFETALRSLRIPKRN